jgi:tetratricopeptide (TPR) repeat protein
MGKHNLAIEKYQEALKIKPDFGSDFKIGYCYALTENYLEALRRTDQFISLAPSNGTKALGYLLKGFYYQILGRSEHAFKEWDVAEGLLRSVQDNYSINIVKRSRVWSYYESGKMELFQKYAKERVDHRIKNKISSEALNTAYEKYYAGFYDLGQNRLEAIPPRLAEIESLFPKAADKQEAAFMQECYHHLASEMLLAQGKIDEALEEYKKISRQEISFANVAFILTAASLNLPFRDDFVARAMVAKGEKDKAIAEYERILQPLNTNNHLAHPLARFRLARLYEEKGLRKEASEQYQRVVGIWKDADPAFEEVQIARRRLIALQAH